MKKSIGLIVLGAVVLSAGSAGAGFGFAKGRFSGFGQLEWESTCSKPYFPRAEYAEAWQASSITSSYQDYVRCVTDNARGDMAYASDRIVEEAQEEIDDVKSDAQLAGWTFR